MKVLKGVAGDGDGYLLIDDLVDTGRTAQAVRRLLPKAYFATLYAKPAGRADRRHLRQGVQADEVDPLPLGHRVQLRHADQGRRPRLRPDHGTDARHRQQELLVLVAAAVGRACGTLGIAVRGGAAPVRQPDARRRSASSTSPAGKVPVLLVDGAARCGTRSPSARPRRAAFPTSSSGPRTPRRARMRALGLRRDALRLPGAAQRDADEHPQRAIPARACTPEVAHDIDRIVAHLDAMPRALRRRRPLLFGELLRRRRDLRAGASRASAPTASQLPRPARAYCEAVLALPAVRSGSPRRARETEVLSQCRRACYASGEDLRRRRRGARRAARPAGEGPRLRRRRRDARGDGRAGLQAGRQGFPGLPASRRRTRSTRSRAPSARPAAATRASRSTPRRTSRSRTTCARRDLTINAIAKDEDGTLIDPFDGRHDLDRTACCAT